MKEGDIVLTPIPQADGNVKNRPVLIFQEMPSYRDVLVCGVSTQLHYYIQGFDEIIFNIPTKVHEGNFVLRLTEGVTRPAETLRPWTS